jgi:hypothetical protein
MIEQYSVDQKLAGLDLHGLACRIPEPVGEQANCSHQKKDHVYMGDGYLDEEGEWIEQKRLMDVTAFEDIPGTNNLKCTICGYTRRY